jgi:hypothetical protein
VLGQLERFNAPQALTRSRYDGDFAVQNSHKRLLLNPFDDGGGSNG